MRSPLEMWTVYQDPADYPGSYVVRAWRVGEDGPENGGVRAVVATLAEAQAAIPAGLINLGRQDDDDPAILETWV